MPGVHKLLIASYAAGSGHIRVAEALIARCRQLYPATTILHCDLAAHTAPFFRCSPFSAQSYNFLVARFPLLYRWEYTITDTSLTQSFFVVASALFRKGFVPFLNKVTEFKPDRILATHLIAAPALSAYTAAPLDMVVTDYHPHWAWAHRRVRHFFVPSEQARLEMEQHQCHAMTTGIPIHPDFFIHKDTHELKRRYGITNNHPVVLVMPLGNPILENADIIRALGQVRKPINTIMIVSNKKTLDNKAQLLAINPQCRILDRVIQIDEWMRMADVIITKPGGSTITEALYLQKQMILINPIPGQEELNQQYFVEQGFAVGAQTASELQHRVEQLLESPSLLKKVSLPDASKLILEHAVV